MSSSVANAQHLQKMDLHLGESDINFLQSILPCLASSQSLQELDVTSDASGLFSGCARHRLSTVWAYVHAFTHIGNGVLFDWRVWCSVVGFFH